MSYESIDETSSDIEIEEEFKDTKDSIVFLIDARKCMVKTVNPSEQESQINSCLRVVMEVMKMKIIAQDSSSIGVTFFGSRETDGNSDCGQGGVFTLFDIAAPSAQRIRYLATLIKDSENFEKQIGSQSDNLQSCPIKQALWSCSQSFGSKSLSTNTFKRIWIFTNDDFPNKLDLDEQLSTITVARDCSQASIEISLWHLNPQGSIFNPEHFYLKMLTVSSMKADDECGIEQRMLGSGYDGFSSLIDSVRKRIYRKRRLGNFQLSISPGDDSMKISVDIYKTILISKKPTHCLLDGRSNKPLRSVTKYFNSLTGEVVEDRFIGSFVDIAGNLTKFDRMERDCLKSLGNMDGIGLRVLFCAPRSSLPKDLNVTTPYFLYPDESSIQGSNAVFEAFLRDLAGKNLVAIARFNVNYSTKPRVVALVPQLEDVDSDGCQNFPPGFQLLILPFAEDIRFNPQVNNLIASINESVIESSAFIVKSIQCSDNFAYRSDVENPSLRQFYSVVQAIALSSSEIEWDVMNDDNMRPTDLDSLKEVDRCFETLRANTMNSSEIISNKPKRKAADTNKGNQSSKRSK